MKTLRRVSDETVTEWTRHFAAWPSEQSAPIEMALIAYAMTHPRSSMRYSFTAELVEIAGAASVRGRGVSEQKAALAARLFFLP